jgi:hypothetical protein
MASEDRTVRLWDVASGTELRTLKGHTAAVLSVAFSPDGARLATASEDRTAKVWDALTGHELRTLKEHTAPVVRVAFNVEGTGLATVARDGMIRIYDARPLTPALRIELEAAAVVDALFAQYVLRDDVLKSIPAYAGITEPVRAAALAMATKRRDDPETINLASWSIVRQPDGGMERYLKALRWAEAAWRLKPDGTYELALGMAQYRTGKYSEAVATLRRVGGISPADTAFLAMAHHRLGHQKDAREQLAWLREYMKDPGWRENMPESPAFLQEAEALIEGRPDQRKMSHGEPRS